MIHRIKKQNNRFLTLLSILLLTTGYVSAQSADSLIVGQMRKEGIRFSNDNSVTLLMSGQEKFDDMFKAIRQAKSSVHLEYFNFRNDSIASLLFDILAEKTKQGVEVRALFDGFGNDSNNRPLKSTSSTHCAFPGLTMCSTATTGRLS